MKVYIEVVSDTIISISDILKEHHTDTIEAENPDELYKSIDKYKLDENINIEDTIKNYFDHSEEGDNLTSYNIKHWVSNRSFGELIDMYENNEIQVPNMQRSFVWDSLRCSRLIESIILGLPIPPLFLLEVGTNTYELIDGYQRISALSNYVGGKQWNYDSQIHERVIPSKLSKKVAYEIAGKKFEDLDEKYQRMIKRSTIPLIEFKQLEPDNFDSKYLIFERINTGSEKLNPMQIRKSLAYGEFIEQLYEFSSNEVNLNLIFTAASIRKDAHVEALLRTYCMYNVYFDFFTTKQSGIKNILNEFCEKKRKIRISSTFLESFSTSLSQLIDIFGKSSIFRRVEIDEYGEKKYSGNVNVSIMESLLGMMIHSIEQNKVIDSRKLEKNYLLEMAKVTAEGLTEGNNPFTINTGSKISITQRFNISKRIVESSYDI